MEIVIIEKQAFEKLISRVEAFACKTEALLQKHGVKKPGEWYDNQDVCLLLLLLHISLRILLTLRERKLLPFTRLSRRIYYAPADVEALVPMCKDRIKGDPGKPSLKESEIEKILHANYNKAFP